MHHLCVCREKVGAGERGGRNTRTRDVEVGLIHCIPRIYTGKLFTLAFSYPLLYTCIYIFIWRQTHFANLLVRLHDFPILIMQSNRGERRRGRERERRKKESPGEICPGISAIRETNSRNNSIGFNNRLN